MLHSQNGEGREEERAEGRLSDRRKINMGRKGPGENTGRKPRGTAMLAVFRLWNCGNF